MGCLLASSLQLTILMQYNVRELLKVYEDFGRSMHVYDATVLRFANKSQNQLSQIFRQILQNATRGEAWSFVSWEQACAGSKDGGMGMRDVISKGRNIMGKRIAKIHFNQPWANHFQKIHQWCKGFEQNLVWSIEARQINVERDTKI